MKSVKKISLISLSLSVLLYSGCNKAKPAPSDSASLITLAEVESGSAERDAKDVKAEEKQQVESPASDAVAEEALQNEFNLPKGFDPFEKHRDRVGSSCYTFPVFRVYGFSPDGKMAYSTEEEVEGRGGAVFDYVIQDLVTDKILWKSRYDTEDSTSDSEGGEGLSSTSTASAFRNKKEELLSAMKKYGISPGDEPFLDFPTEKGYVCIADFADVPTGGEDEWLGNIDYKITVKSPAGKSKTVASARGERAYQVVACGYIKNPYEDRIAIIFGVERYTFEGTGISYRVAGCDLGEKSFK